MKNTSQWLISFNSHESKHLNHLISERKSSFNKTVTVSVTGGKGGVGKTSISLKLSRELSKIGFKVLLIDCDTNLSNTAIKLNLPLKNEFSALIKAEKSFDECLHKDGSFHLLSSCNGNLDMFDSTLNIEEVIIDIINSHEEEYDFIFLDCPAGLSKESLTLNAYCDQRVIVVTPDKSSITDSYSLMKILSMKYKIKENHLLINMLKNKNQYEQIVKTLSETVENFLGGRTHILGGISYLEVLQDKFDQEFLHEEQSSCHREFSKIINSYTEGLYRLFEKSKSPLSTPTKSLEHEVYLS